MIYYSYYGKQHPNVVAMVELTITAAIVVHHYH